MLENLDALLLARIQFAFTVSFHFFFPAFSIGLASYLAVLEGLWLKTGKSVYLDLFKYWLKIFAIAFAMGVVSGIVMSYQFGTNWAVFSDKAGPVIGPLMAYEVLTAFFLEAGFLGVMLFGMSKVGKKLHFVVGAVGAWHLLKDRTSQHARTMFSMAMWMAAIVTPAQIFAGDMHGLNTLEHQPAKVMAMEGHYQSHPEGAPLILFGIPDSEAKVVRYAIEIPKASSLILKHDLDAPMAGLDTIPDDREPPVPVIFWSFRIMVGIGFAMLGIGLWSLWGRVRGTLYDLPWLHRAAVRMGPSGFAAVLAG
ncbi:MAG: cytochrome ubiquinol oxidase subunit I, partial [Alphaproteobacteria bacterium PA3]